MLLAANSLGSTPLAGGADENAIAVAFNASSLLLVEFDRNAAPSTVSPASADDIRVDVLFDGLGVDAFTNIDLTVT